MTSLDGPIRFHLLQTPFPGPPGEGDHRISLLLSMPQNRYVFSSNKEGRSRMDSGFVARERAHSWQVRSTDADGKSHTSIPLDSERATAKHIQERRAAKCTDVVVHERWLTATHTMVDPDAPPALSEPGRGRSAHYRICYRMFSSAEWLQRIVPTQESVARGVEYVARKHPAELMVVMSEIERLERQLTTAEIDDLMSRNGAVPVAGT